MPKLRVLVVDDAVVMRRMISEAIARDPELEVVGTAADGRIALAKLTQLNPDVVTLDVEMPNLDGVATVAEIRKMHTRLPVIMFSTLTQRGASATLDALAKGATDYVTKPANVGSIAEGLKRLESELIPKIKIHCRKLSQPAAVSHARAASLLSRQPFVRPAASTGPAAPIDAVCIGCSTGGPNALAEIFSKLPGPFTQPFFIVQHMPPLFTAMLAERLGKTTGARFFEARHAQLVEPGCAYVAPGGFHMEVRPAPGGARIALTEEPPENSCRPAVDVLFRSAAAVYGAGCLGIVLTGMGQDGLRGCEHLRERRAPILAQDEASSVVWGMPGAVAGAGLADGILPLAQIAPEIVRRLSLTRPPARVF